MRKAEHSSLEYLCENIIETQSGEIAQLRTWLWDWYQHRAPRHQSGGKHAVEGPDAHRETHNSRGH